MKKSKILSKAHATVLFASAALLFLTVQTSCNKDKLNAEDKPLLTTKDMNATVMSITPNDGLDDTKDIQKAIDNAAANGGGTVWLPDGDYNVKTDSVSCIHLKSNVTLSMGTFARLIAEASDSSRYYVIKVTGIHDANIIGGEIVGDRLIHTGSGGEWGFGISIQGCDNILVRNTRISNCWGDGVLVGGYQGTPSTGVTLKKVQSRTNRRQGLSVLAVDGLAVDSCIFGATSGTAPADGIDIEPDVHPGSVRIAENITITNCNIYNNDGNGIEINARSGNIVRYVTMRYNKIHGNKYSGYFHNGDHITFKDNTLYDNTYDQNQAHVVTCTNSVFTPNTIQ